jgi:hypothetical protein
VDRDFGRPAEGAFSRLQLPAKKRPYSVVRLLARRNGNVNLVGTRADGRSFAVQLLRGGRLWRGFGSNGIELTPWTIEDAALDSQGRIVAVGHEWRDFTKVIFRLLPNGHRDRGFGGGFAVDLDVGEEGWVAIAVGPNRRPLVLDSGLSICRQTCPPTPALFRFLGGARRDRR